MATRYQNCAAPAVTPLFCLLVISLKSLICSFVNLFTCCWHKNKRLHRPGHASVSVAFRAVGFTKCLFFFLESEEEELTANYLGSAFVNKTQSAWDSLSVLPHHVDVSVRNDWSGNRESKGDINAGPGSHQVDLGHSCVEFWVAVERQCRDAIKWHLLASKWAPSLIYRTEW